MHFRFSVHILNFLILQNLQDILTIVMQTSRFIWWILACLTFLLSLIWKTSFDVWIVWCPSCLGVRLWGATLKIREMFFQAWRLSKSYFVMCWILLKKSSSLEGQWVGTLLEKECLKAKLWSFMTSLLALAQWKVLKIHDIMTRQKKMFRLAKCSTLAWWSQKSARKHMRSLS